jgi:hypothetical protein
LAPLAFEAALAGDVRVGDMTAIFRSDARGRGYKKAALWARRAGDFCIEDARHRTR